MGANNNRKLEDAKQVPANETATPFVYFATCCRWITDATVLIKKSFLHAIGLLVKALDGQLDASDVADPSGSSV